MKRDPRTSQERAVLLLRALIPEWLPMPTSGFQCLVWTIWISFVLGVSLLIIYAVDKSFWTWLKLLIIPAVIAGVGIWFNYQQQKREQRIANQHAQDEALQAYLDQMSQLLTDKDQPLHMAQPGDRLSTTARARTLTLLTRLDGERKGSVVRFLHESGLIAKDQIVLVLAGANLRDAFLIDAELSDAFLSGVNLHGADLRDASLHGANLHGANLHGADLHGAILVNANLSWADDLREADLREADLRHAVLIGARGITNEELEQQASSLEGATMPDGSKHR